MLVGPAQFNVQGSAYGAKGNGSDETANILAAANAAIAAGGGTVFLPYPTSGGFYGISGRLPIATRLNYVAPPGTTIKWIGSAPGSTTAMFGNTAVAGAPVVQPGMFGLNIDAGSVARVTPMWLASVQRGLFDYVNLKNANGVAGQVALKMDSLVGTDFNNNTMFNSFRHFNIGSARVGVQCTGVSAAVAVTDNAWNRVYLEDISDTGWDFVSYCDSNQIQHYRIGATGGVVFTGVKLNSGVPASSNGVYNVHFADGFIDCASGLAGTVGIVFNKGAGNSFRKLWTSIGPGGSTGTLFTDLNNCSSYLVELFSHDPAFETSTGVFYIKGEYWQTKPSNVNGVSFTGGDTGTAPIISAGGVGSDANTALSIRAQGTGAVNVGANQPNFFNFIPGADGAGSAPIFQAAGGATDVDLRILNQGKGRTFINNGFGGSGTVPTVGSTGVGVSAASVIAGGNNSECQVQATLTAVAPGVVIGVVAFAAAVVSAPKAVVCSLSAPTAGVASPPIVGADTYTVNGFTLRSYGPTTVTTGTYLITCHVFF